MNKQLLETRKRQLAKCIEHRKFIIAMHEQNEKRVSKLVKTISEYKTPKGEWV